MFVDVEEILGRELREVADGLQIPAMPPSRELPRARRRWQPLLVAAAVVLIVAGAVVLVATTGDDPRLEPAPQPTSPTEPVVTIPTTPPKVPYVLDQRLYVKGSQVPGTWGTMYFGYSGGWIALRADGTWWWGLGPEPHEITGYHDVPPAISPNGRYVAEIHTENGEGVLTGLDTGRGGEVLGRTPFDLDGVSIAAVTNDGKVIIQGTSTTTSLLWLPLAGNKIVDLTVTAPKRLILDGTPAGLVATDGDIYEPVEDPYLAEISEDGKLTRIVALPDHGNIVGSPGAEWLAWVGPDTLGGEVTHVSRLEAQTVDGTQQATMNAPPGWSFRVMRWVWEDDDHLVAPVTGDGGERMARCSAQSAHCVLIDSR